MGDIYSLHKGTAPILISAPHAGQAIPDEMLARMTDAARARPDTDWHMERLYDFAPEMGISFLFAHYNRYVVDLNRADDGESLYPGENVTELVPTTTFNMEDIYQTGKAPTADDIAKRVEVYWKPYHQALASEIARIKDEHGYCILFEAHSIRSEVVRFFEGTLPMLNWGTNYGASSNPILAEACVDSIKKSAPDLTQVINGRFKGGYITRVFGAPSDGVHAIQLELAQRVYMDENPPYTWDKDRAASTVDALKHLFDALLKLKL